MRKIILCLFLAMALAVSMSIYEVKEAKADVTLNLRATWVGPVDTDLAGYNFRQTNGGNKAWTATGWVVGDTGHLLLPLTPLILNFPVVLPISPSTGTLTFNMRAVDTNANTGSFGSDGNYVFNIDVTPPGVCTSLTITKP